MSSRPIVSVRDIAAAARGRRQRLALSQAEVSRRAQVSRQWVNEFEAGKPTAELGLVIQLLDALGLSLTLTEPGAEPPVTEGPAQARPVDLDALLDEYRSL